LEATGSVVRDHLANERTFLSWGRVSLVFIAAGVGVHQFYEYQIPIDYPGKKDEKEREIIKSRVQFASGSLVFAGFTTLAHAIHRCVGISSILIKTKC